MNIKKIVISILIIFVICTSVIYCTFPDRNVAKIDIIAINDITESIAEQWGSLNQKGNLNQTELPCLEYGLDYVVLDSKNQFISATKEGLNNTLNSAISNRDTIVDIKIDNKVVGKLIIYNDSNVIWNKYRKYLMTISEIIIIFTAFLCIIYALLIDKSIFKPFRKLQDFARHVAEGKLDMPLEMDKGNLFGAFTESFDLMREELSRARENERLANQSKKELVASLSHDIKTPVASIMAVSEVMYAKSKDENEKKHLEVINSKADQINILITNMFNATLEELQELKVTVSEQSSKLIYDLIKKADYNNQVSYSSNAECIVLIDELRLAQVIDNVISNSYKYAGTFIDVSMQIKENYLEIAFKDFGLGVPDEECPLLFNKYYRAKNSEGKSGTGLGLYISKYLMNKMSGDIECENWDDGFSINLKLRIV